MSKARTAKRATVSEDQDTEPRAWAEIHPERRGWVRAVMRRIISEQRIPGYAPGMAIVQAERIEALYAAIALLSAPCSPPTPKPGKPVRASS